MTHPQPKATQQPLFIVTWRQSQPRGKGTWFRSWWFPLCYPSSPIVIHNSMLHPRKHSPALPHPWDPADLQGGAVLILQLEYDQAMSPSEIKFWTYYLDNISYVRDYKNLKPSTPSQHVPFMMNPTCTCTAFAMSWQCKQSFNLGIYDSHMKN
jgi:hypothetical protein